MTKKRLTNIFLALFAVAVIFGVSFIGARIGAASRTETEREAEIPEAGSSIVLAGYDKIRLRAGQKLQSVFFTILKKTNASLYFPYSLKERNCATLVFWLQIQKLKVCIYQSLSLQGNITMLYCGIPVMTYTRKEN